ncbi:hypothetical protein BC828DRAFT_372207 [Blastocladiella britannica]|nr:hypothetical protein BC828DRAFT_372207 [Blastocladiella britannica]
MSLPVRRIVSVLPSATEIICLLPGGAERMVGRSHECDFPKKITHLPILTGQKTTFTSSADVDKQVSTALSTGQSLYTLDTDQLSALKPDLILTQDICDVCAIDLQTVHRVAAKMTPEPAVVTLNPNSLHDVLHNILQVGDVIGEQAGARTVYNELLARLVAVQDWTRTHVKERPNVAFIEWVDPIFFGGHWTPQLIELAGGYHPLNTVLKSQTDHQDLLAQWKDWTYGTSPYTKSYRITAATLAAKKPEILLIAPCGLDIPTTERELRSVVARADSWWWSMSPRPKRIVLVDGNHMFNRPGPRLVEAAEFVQAMLHRPDVLAERFPSTVFPWVELDVEEWFDPARVQKEI